MTELTRHDLDEVIANLRRDIDIRFSDINAKLDAKPTIAALYQAVIVMMFGLSATIASTVVVLKNLNLLR